MGALGPGSTSSLLSQAQVSLRSPGAGRAQGDPSWDIALVLGVRETLRHRNTPGASQSGTPPDRCRRAL